MQTRTFKKKKKKLCYDHLRFTVSSFIYVNFFSDIFPSITFMILPQSLFSPSCYPAKKGMKTLVIKVKENTFSCAIFKLLFQLQKDVNKLKFLVIFFNNSVFNKAHLLREDGKWKNGFVLSPDVLVDLIGAL